MQNEFPIWIRDEYNKIVGSILSILSCIGNSGIHENELFNEKICLKNTKLKAFFKHALELMTQQKEKGFMKIGVTEVSPRAIQRAAEKKFKGGYYCCEALMSAIREEFKLDVPEEVIAMTSGMAVGAGKSGCACGAFNGGILALGMFFGRTEQKGPTDPKSIKCMELTHELHDWFKKANGKNAICCRILTKEFNMGQGEHKEQCIYFTGLCAWKVAQIVCRELGIKNLDEIDEPAERRTIAEI